MTTPTALRYQLESVRAADRFLHRYRCNLCGERGTWISSSSVAHDAGRHHLATVHPELGVEWS